MRKERNINLDLIRIIAVFFVISVHFLLNNGFYSSKMNTIQLWIMNLIRVLSMTCVPLFLILSGYLCNKKEVTKKYYTKIIPILIIYVLVSIITIIYKISQGEEFTILSSIKVILNFTGIGYAWYVEMYIGLFLLIPFLNKLWNNLSKKERKILIIISIFTISLPTLVNIWDLSFNKGLKEIFLATNSYDKIIPEWWIHFYPIMYYFIGCYIYNYKDDIKISIVKMSLLLFILIILFGSFNYFRCDGELWRVGIYSKDSSSFESLICSCLLFVILLKCNINVKNKYIKEVLYKISDVSFCMYLMSYIFDIIIYKKLNTSILNVSNKLYYYPLVVTSIFILAFISSIVICMISNYINKILLKKIN